MKKTVLVLILILGVVAGAVCQNSGPMDLVVLLDTSASMSSSYRETSDYLIGPFLKEFLRIGDTFHLISFSNKPRVEISRRVENVGDVEAIIGRLLLMYPLDPQTDVAGALSFSESYSASLPNRSTKMVLVTDGDAAGVQNLVNDNTGRLKNKGIDLQYIKVPVTGTGPSSGRPPAQTAARPATQTVPAQTAATPPAAQTAPVTAAAPAASSAQTTQTTQTAQSAQTTQTTQTTQSGTTQTAQTTQSTQTGSAPSSISTGPVSQTPAQTQPSSSSGISSAPTSQTTQTTQTTQTGSASSAQPSTATGSAPATSTPVQSAPATSSQPSPSSASSTTSSSGIQPQQSYSDSDSSGSLFSSGIPLWLLILLILLALLILGLLAFLIAKRLHSSPNRAMAQAAAPSDSANLMSSYAEEQKKQARPPLEYPPKEMKPMPKDKVYKEEELTSSSEGDPVMLNLFVEDQNTAIGRRNIHNVKAGYSFSVGGGKSDFLIFLVSMPPHIADVTYDGRNCTFIPRKPEHFPDLGSQSVPACIGKNIRVLSEKKYELHIRFERYQDPLNELNKMLHSITVPG